MKKFVLTKDIMEISEKVDFPKNLYQSNYEISNISDTYINGVIKRKKDRIDVNLNVTSKLFQKCAISLKDVEVNLDFKLHLIFSNQDYQDYGLDEIEDLYIILLGNIILEKPYNVYHESIVND